MSQPPANQPPPDWRRPRGVAPGTWAYVNQRSIADHYDDFVADTPLCQLDDQIIRQAFPGFPREPSDQNDSAPNVIAPSDQGDKSCETILDLGCGTGRTAIPLAKRGYEVIGVDLSRKMLEKLLAKSNVAEPNLAKRVHGVQANLVQLECFADDSVDHAVCMFSTLGMIAGRDNRQAMLGHVARIVRPHGKFVLHVHNRWAALHEPGGTRKLASSWWRSLREREHEFGDASYAYRGLEKMFMHRYSRGELVSDLESCGWMIDEMNLVSLDGASMVQSIRKAGGFIVIAKLP